MRKHTPGPWELREYKQEKIISSWNVHIGEYQVHLFPYKRIYSEDLQQSGFVQDDRIMADAHLIAAAPDLLEALKLGYEDTMDYIKINHLGGQNNHWLVLAREAIAKAEGKA